MKNNFKPYPKPGKPLSRIKPMPKIQYNPPILPTKPGYVRRIFTLTHASFSILQRCVRDQYLGVKSYEEALQVILLEWKTMKDYQHHPVLIAVPTDMLPHQDKPTEAE